MRRKWWFAVAGIFGLAALAAIGFSTFLPPTPGLTYANYSRIHNGMTFDQTKAILGDPIFAHAEAQNCWKNDTGDVAWISFDDHGLVDAATWNGTRDSRNALEKLRDRLPLLAHDPPPWRLIAR